MAFFEWIGEMLRPGPVGTVGTSSAASSWQPQRKFLVWILTILGMAILGLFIWKLTESDAWWQWLIVFTVYLTIAYFISVQPHTNNMGWFGGLVDNPFRISDDVNRIIALMAILLLPGKIVLYALQTIINTIRLFRTKRID